MRIAAAVFTVLVAPTLAAADPSLSSSTSGAAPSLGTADNSVGFRVGGYGFRREGDLTPASGWNECRMNGLGVFLDHDFGRTLFVEGGLDAYFSQDFVLASPTTDLPLDRMSGLVSGAIGARTYLAPWLRAYVQLGAGVELTRLAVPYGDDGTTIRANKVLPEGFFGIGADLRLARGLYAGMSIRMLVMGNFDYSASRLQMDNQWIAQPTPDQVFAASPDLAMQGQFYVRHDL